MTDLFLAEVAKIPELDDLALPLIQCFKLGKGLVQRQEFLQALDLRKNVLVEGHAPNVPSTLGRRSFPCMIHQDLPHQVRGNSDEVSAILPGLIGLFHEAEIRFINQGRRLEGMAGPLPAQISCRNAPQLVIDECKETRLGVSLAGAEFAK
jgi:hypothetical protein